MKQIKKYIFFLLLFCLCPKIIKAQAGIVAAGGTSTGSGGNFTYSSGQVVYRQFTGTGGFIIEGVQQPWEISIVTSIENTDDINLECEIYPNPTAGFLRLTIRSFEDDNMSFRLYDINGILLQDYQIEATETVISLSKLRVGVYLLKIIKNNREVKVFKIIRN